jgi:hypothetical protein
MPNEFKVRNGLIINSSGSTLLEIQGAQGQLATATDSLSGSLYSIDDISGIPVLEVISDNTVNIGTFRNEGLKVSGSFAIITGSLLGTASISSFTISASNALSSSYTFSSSYASSSANAFFASTASFVAITTEFPYTGSAQVSGSVFVTGSSQITGSLGVTGSVGFNYIGIGVWNTGGAMITARSGLGGVGTQNAALGFGGTTTLNSPTSATEAYNGTSWSANSNMITGRVGFGSTLAGVGTQNAALGFGGYINPNPVSCTEAFNGTSWRTATAMITARRTLAGAGTQNAALGFGGTTTAGVTITCTEAYNGSTWTAGSAIITARLGLAGAGTQNAALAFGGSTGIPVLVACTEAYNGSTWSTLTAMITARGYLAGAGTQTSAVAFGGGFPVTVACTELYNGTSWTVGGAMITARTSLAGAGTQNAALAFGGSSATPTGVACTEAYNIGFQTFNYSPSTGNLTIGTTFSTSSLNVTGSINVSGSGVINNLTASYATTASFANNVIPITSKTLVIAGTPTIQVADIITYPMWRIPFPVTASLISVYSTGSLLASGSQVNASKNSSLLLATPLALTGSRWVSSSVLQNQNFVAGDILSFNFLSLTGSLTSVIVQVDFIK